MTLPRLSVILLHPTSLPSSYGIGLWQVLPLGPTGYGDSPYQSFSTFALNPLLIDVELSLVRQKAI